MRTALHNARFTLRNARSAEEADDGFTLIELLVVVVILGILIAIAIPVYLNYRKSAYDKSAQSDLRGAISTLEVCSSDGSYPTTNIANSTTAGSASVTGALSGCGTGTGAKISLSSGTSIAYYKSSDNSNYITSTKNSGGTKFYCYASATGGAVVQVSAQVGAYADACS